MAKKQVYLKSFGCQMNQADSERFLGILERSGYHPTERPQEADLILLNTCAIRDKAEQKVFSDLGRFRALKRARPGLRIAVAGCVAQSLGRRIFSREPAVDLVLGTGSMDLLPGLLRRVERDGRGIHLARFDETPGDLRTDSIPSSPVRAYVPVIYGCENFCTYCVVPSVRGPERSRPVETILAEVRDLASRGFREVTLLGQNVNSYGKKSKNTIMFHDLLYLIHEIDGVERIRFVTSHPRDLSRELISAMAELPKVCEALHLPVQSGSDRILRAMNRGYTREQYLEKLVLLREAVPGVAVTTDMIVGFPGEGEADFEASRELLSEAGFDQLFGFCFSPRPGTPAAGLPDPVDAETAGRRLAALFERQRALSLSRNRALVGSLQEVLVEETGGDGPHPLSGRTRTNKIVHFRGQACAAGEVVSVRILEGMPHCLIGEARREGDPAAKEGPAHGRA